MISESLLYLRKPYFMFDKNHTMITESFCSVDVNVHLKLHLSLYLNNHIKATTSFKQIYLISTSETEHSPFARIYRVTLRQTQHLVIYNVILQ